MQTRMIGSFAKMVGEGLCTIDDLPEEYRIPVTEYINNPPANEVISHKIIPVNEKLGPLTLPRLNSHIDTKDFKELGYATASYKTNVIFDQCISGIKPEPINPIFDIKLLEAHNIAFLPVPEVEVLSTDFGFDIRIYGDMDEITVSDLTLMRIDMNVKSKNYEDMTFTTIIKSK